MYLERMTTNCQQCFKINYFILHKYVLFLNFINIGTNTNAVMVGINKVWVP